MGPHGERSGEQGMGREAERRNAFEKKLGEFLQRGVVEKLLEGRKMEGGSVEVRTITVGGDDNEVPYYFAEIATENGGRIFITDTPDDPMGLMHITGVVMNRERWTYNFDGDHTTRVESSKGYADIVDDQGAGDMQGLRDHISRGMPGVDSGATFEVTKYE